MEKKAVMPDQAYKLVNNLVRYLDEQDKAYKITKLSMDTGKGSNKIDNRK